MTRVTWSGQMSFLKTKVICSPVLPAGWRVSSPDFLTCIQLFWERVVGKMCRGQSWKVIWDMINTLFLTTVAFEPTFVTFHYTRGHFSVASHAFLSNFFGEQGRLKPPTIPFGIVACTFSNNLSQNSCIWFLEPNHANTHKFCYLCKICVNWCELSWRLLSFLYSNTHHSYPSHWLRKIVEKQNLKKLSATLLYGQLLYTNTACSRRFSLFHVYFIYFALPYSSWLIKIPVNTDNGHYLAVFSLNFSSAAKGPFMAGKAKNMPQRHTFLVGGGGGRG